MNASASRVRGPRPSRVAARFGADEAAGVPGVGPGLPTSRAASGPGAAIGPGVDTAAGRVRAVLDEGAGRDLAAALSALRRAMECPGITTTERRALAGALSTVAGVARVRLERIERAANDRRARQCPRGDG